MSDNHSSQFCIIIFSLFAVRSKVNQSKIMYSIDTECAFCLIIDELIIILPPYLFDFYQKMELIRLIVNKEQLFVIIVTVTIIVCSSRYFLWIDLWPTNIINSCWLYLILIWKMLQLLQEYLWVTFFRCWCLTTAYICHDFNSALSTWHSKTNRLNVNFYQSDMPGRNSKKNPLSVCKPFKCVLINWSDLNSKESAFIYVS